MQKERKLSSKETRRKEKFELLANDLNAKGYIRHDLILEAKDINTKAIITMIPYMLIAAVLFFMLTYRFTYQRINIFILIAAYFVLIVIHELIHGLVWSLFTKKGFKAIDFGIMMEALAPYCTCDEKMEIKHYILGLVAPTIILGLLLTSLAILYHNLTIFILAELLILGGGGDYCILLKLLKFKSDKQEIYCIDHPYECGLVIFEK